MYKLLRQSIIREKLRTPRPTCISVQKCLTQIQKKEDNPPVSNIKKYPFNKFMDYIKRYERILEKNFPRSMKVYRVFSVGTKNYFLDAKRYIKIAIKLNAHGNESLSNEELQLYYTMPKDTRKLLPVLLLTAIPFANYVILPLAYYYPKQMLTSHYWLPEQRVEFALIELKTRLKHNRPLFRCIQAELNNIKDKALRLKWKEVLACIGSGTQPSPKDIIACSSLFIDGPYSMRFLKSKHKRALLAIHGIPFWRPLRGVKLVNRGMMIKQMDQAIQRDGGVSQMTSDAIRWALLIRGVNSTEMTSESMKDWLKQWLTVSETVDEDSICLLLHCPILLAYNHPSNWLLIYN